MSEEHTIPLAEFAADGYTVRAGTGDNDNVIAHFRCAMHAVMFADWLAGAYWCASGWDADAVFVNVTKEGQALGIDENGRNHGGHGFLGPERGPRELVDNTVDKLHSAANPAPF